MNKATKKKRAKASVNTYRARMKREGFRLMQVWVPDIRAPGFAKEFARQAKIVAADDDPEIMAWMEAAQSSALDGWEP